LELKAVTRPQLTHREVIARHLRYQSALGGQPNPAQASAWLRGVLRTGYLVPAGSVEDREYLANVDVYHPLFSAAELREVLDAVTFDRAEIEALLPEPEPTAASRLLEPAEQREKAGDKEGAICKYDWEVIALGIGEELIHRSAPVKNEEVVAMIQAAAARMQLTVPKWEAARKKARRWLRALGKGEPERE
jgi:hypothetical protein